MAKYGVNYYGASKYGATPRLRFSVAPMSVLVSSVVSTDFRKVTISWQSPTGGFTRFRLVRNQAGFPETAEDGVIILDEFAESGSVSTSSFTDGEDNPTDVPLVPGRQVYYRVFLFTDDKFWVSAGSISAIVPSDHGVQTSLLGMIPRVFTSKEQGPLGAVDESSAIYDFLYGFSFTVDEFYTLLDLLRPRHTGYETPVSLLYAERGNVGLSAEPGLPTKNQKRLIREALYMYSHKGTKVGLETYAESVTGFAPDITVSENLLLSVQDSTFYNSTGNWVFENATAEASEEQVPATGDNVIDNAYTCKVTATDAFSMILGADNPITKGVPVIADTEYVASCKVKSPPSDGNVFISIDWYDGTGTFISADNGSTVSANNTWKTASVIATAPSNAVYAVLQISSSADGQYYIDQVCMQLSDTVAYDEARAVDIFLNPTNTNYIVNPSFETNVTDGWTLSGSATAAQDVDVSTAAYSGVKSAKITATGSWSITADDIPVTFGNYYTFSSYVKSTAPFSITFEGKDSSNISTGHIETVEFDTSADWTRVSVTDLIDAIGESDVAYYAVSINGGTGIFYIDCVQFERSTKATDYFDGSLPSTFGAVWESTEDNSYTHLYPNKPSKSPRLAKTLRDWIPQNTFWRLRTYDGLEYTNLTV
jgi:hypothetical protein